MCGFAVVSSPQKIGVSLSSKMLSMIAHRGPDAQSMISFDHVSMAHARLSVVGGPSGHQPMRTNDNRLWLVFNGEIYNHAELRAKLVSEGKVFQTESDTESILLGYQHWGDSVFEMLDGMFSIVIWNSVTQEIVCARDRYGIKPVFVATMSNGGISIASELVAFKPLREEGLLSSSISQNALAEYLTMGYVLEPTTWYEDTNAIEPGTVVKWKVTEPFPKMLVKKYWSLLPAMMSSSAKPSLDEGRHLIHHAVSSQLPPVRDASLSVFLSGGLDSTILATLSKKELVDAPMKAFSAYFNNSQVNESIIAKRVSSDLGIDFEAVNININTGMDAQKVLDVYQEPFSDNASLPTCAISEKASRHGKIVLSGDGADELFFGYRNHWLMNFESKIKPRFGDRGLYSGLISAMAKISTQSTSVPRVFRWKKTLESMLTPLAHGYVNALSQASSTVVSSLMRKTAHSDHCVSMIVNKLKVPAELAESEDPMKIVQWIDMKAYLPSCILKKVDRAAMHYGLESRVPFLSNSLATVMLSQSSRSQVGISSGKKWLREWTHTIIPDFISKAPKTSFTSPLNEWFRILPEQEVYGKIVAALNDSPWEQHLDMTYVSGLIKEHLSCKAQHGPLLWSLMLLAKFRP